jgi:RNA polymerase sigma-70 factor (TIGR02943 family)
MPVTNEEIISWVRTYTKELFSYTLAKVHQKQIAEDLVQETFLSAYQSYVNFKGKSSEKTWLFSILKHKIADYYRSKYKSGVEVPSSVLEQYFDQNDRWKAEFRPKDWGDEEALLDDPEFKRALNQCFEKLPQKWSVAVQLKYLEEHDAEKICLQLELTQFNFWQIIHRAKLQLRNCLELKWFKR